jgi:hypothetical protein
VPFCTIFGWQVIAGHLQPHQLHQRHRGRVVASGADVAVAAEVVAEVVVEVAAEVVEVAVAVASCATSPSQPPRCLTHRAHPHPLLRPKPSCSPS